MAKRKKGHDPLTQENGRLFIISNIEKKIRDLYIKPHGETCAVIKFLIYKRLVCFPMRIYLYTDRGNRTAVHVCRNELPIFSSFGCKR
jgi:hypothetical protein